tara:strand:+ start:1851 stop:3008 length:1158 start_codon:yes stop_codon:yes gene_type:complete
VLKKKQVKSIGTRLGDKRYIRYSSVYNVYSNVVFYIKFAEVIIIVNHLDLFSGVGGFSLALKRAIGKDKVGWVGYSDIDKHANKVFKRRFPDAEGLGSVTDIQPENLPERIDLVTFGSPCQDFSIAGKRGGISANRSSLFFEAMRIIRAKKPKYFVFENVKGLFSSGKGEDFTIVLREIANAGYDGQWELLNSRFFGVPQNRERIYLVGHLRGQPRPEVFPIRESSKELDIRDAEVANPLQHPGHSGGNYRGMNMVICTDDGASEDYQASMKNMSPCLKSSRSNYKLEFKIADYRNDEGFRIRKDGNSPCLSQRRHSDKDLSTMPPIVIENTSKIRRLTPVECCRLQSYPDDWNDCCSDSQRYKQMGNSITVNVAEEIFRRLYDV